MADEILDDETEYTPGIDDELEASINEPAEPDAGLDDDISEAAEGEDDVADEAEGVEAEDIGSEDLEPEGSRVDADLGEDPLFYGLGNYIPLELTESEMAADPDEGELYTTLEGAPDDESWDLIPDSSQPVARMFSMATVEEATPDETIAAMTVDDFLTENETSAEVKDIDIDTPVAYEIHGKPPEGSWQVLGVVAAEQTEAEVSGLPSGVGWIFRVRTVFSDGTFGIWSAETAVDLPKDLLAPPVPSTPVVVGETGVATLTWDGKGVGGVAQPADYKHTVVWHSLTGVAGTWNNVGILHEAGQHHTTNLPYGQLHYFALSSRDLMGNESSRSAVASVMIMPLVDEESIKAALQEAQDQIDAAGHEIRETGVELAARLADAEAELAEHETRIEASEDDLDILEGTVLPALELEIAGAKGRLAASEAAIAASNTQITAAKGRLDALDSTTIPGLSANIATAKGRLDTLDSTTIPGLTTEINGAKGRLTAAEAAIVASDEAINTTLPALIAAAKAAGDTALLIAHRSTAAPTVANGAKRPVGALWTRVNASNEEIGYWSWNGSAWVAQALSTTVIPNLTASHIASGTIDTARLNAGTIATAVASVIKLDASAITAGTIDTARLNATTIAAAVASIIKLNASAITAGTIDTARLNVTTMAASLATVLKLNASAINAGTISADRLDVNDLAARIATVVKLNASAITAGTIDTARLNVTTLSASLATVLKLNASAINAGTIDTARLNATTIAAATASIQKADIKNLTASSGTMNTAVIEKLWADVVNAKKITAQMLAIGAFDNMIPDHDNSQPSMWTNPDAGPGSGWVSSPTYGTAKASMKLSPKATSVSNMASYAGMPWYPTRIEVKPGDWYTAYSYVYSDGTDDTLESVSQQMYGYDSSGTFTGSNQNGGRTHAADWVPKQWNRVGGTPVQVPEGVFSISPRLTVYRDTGAPVRTVNFYVGPVSLNRASDGQLIVDGAIVANHITASQTLTAKVAQFLEIEAGMIKSNAVTADKIGAGAVTAIKIQANSITADQIAANAITASELAADAVVAVNVKANAITAAKIATDAIEARHIKAESITSAAIAGGTITADRLQVGVGQNLLPDPTFTQLDIDRYNPAGWDTYMSGVGVRAFRYQGYPATGYFEPFGRNTHAYSGGNTSNWISCTPGQQYKFTLTTYGSNYKQWRAYASYLLEDGTYSGYYPAQETTHGTKSIEFTIPAKVIKFNIRVAIEHANASGAFIFYGKDSGLWLKTSGDLLVNGSITADKIAANAITAAKIHADAINGKTITGATITGATVRVENSIAGLEFTPAASGKIRFWNKTIPGIQATGDPAISASISGSLMLESSTRWVNTDERKSHILVTPGHHSDNMYLTAGIRLQSASVEIGAANGAWSALRNGAASLTVASAKTLKLVGDEGTVMTDASISIGSDGNARVWSNAIYNRNYTGAANVHITNAGTLGYSTSARRNKILIEDLREADDAILSLRARTWYDRTESEQIASHLTLIDNGGEAFTEVGKPITDMPHTLRRIPGMVAEEVLDAGLGEFLHYGPDGEVQGLMYDRLGVALIPVVARQRDRIISLESRMTELEERLAA